MSPTGYVDVAVKDVLKGLEAVEDWTRYLRQALSSLDQEQRLKVKPFAAAKRPPVVSGGLCPPPPTDKKKKKPTKK